MILQFGAGNFLRGFADLFVHELDQNPTAAIGPVVVVQSTGIERAEHIHLDLRALGDLRERA